MTRPTIQVINISTQEEIVREMNDEEYERYQHMVADGLAKQTEQATDNSSE